ncbi:MAG: hypothetical protein LBB39_02485 [Mycoplasmataceae bacterium]|jgi:hypothetical protein|nr:hypothetical protein [Mycoplasmataceae bacterium]
MNNRKEVLKRYARTEKGKATRLRYSRSANGKQRMKEATLRYKKKLADKLKNQEEKIDKNI